MQLGKRDLVWSYLAQFLSVTYGIIILPIVLRYLTENEVGFYFILLSVASFVALIDFGFTPQFSRNITYVYSGSRTLLKEGIDVDTAQKNDDIDYGLLCTVIATARRTYSILAWIALAIMAMIGTGYIYRVTDGFISVGAAEWVWGLFGLAIFFNLRFAYYNMLLIGSGQVRKAQQAIVASRVLQIIAAYVVLYLGYGLLGWVCVYLVVPFVQRALMYMFYFTKELRARIEGYRIPGDEKKELFKILWHNSKRGGLCKLAEFTTSQVVVLISGVFLSLKEVASFGLMQQLFVVSHTVAITAMVTFQPQMAYWLAKGQNETMRRKMAWGMQIFYIVFIAASLVIIFAGQPILRWIGSNSMLPATGIVCVFAVLRLLESNYLDLCQVFVMSNRYPFVRDVLLTGIGIIVLAYVLTAVIPLGVWGLVLAMGICQLSWNDWYWARRALREMQISFFSFLKLGFVELRTTVSGFLADCTRRLHLS